MGDLDPASEALIRQLHRELNGLTRSRRGSAPTTQFVSLETVKKTDPATAKAGDGGGRHRPKTSSRDRSRGGSRGTGSGSRKRTAGDTDEEDSDEEDEEDESESQEGSTHAGRAGQQQQQPPVKQQRKESSHDTKPARQPKHPSPKQQVPGKSSSHQEGSRKRPHGSSTKDDIVKGGAHNGHSQPPQRRTQSQATDPRQPDRQSADASPPKEQPTAQDLATAAAAASSAVRELVRRQGRPVEVLRQGGPRHVKCFYAGVRWGIHLSHASLCTRNDLATALNLAFAGHIISCRGDMLHIVFLDNEGNLVEFPAVRTTGAKDDASEWDGAVDKALKVYVRRG